jgi:hypothetical protein
MIRPRNPPWLRRPTTIDPARGRFAVSIQAFADAVASAILLSTVVGNATDG